MARRSITPLPYSLAVFLLLYPEASAHAQQVIPRPVTDSSAQASPLTPLPKAPVNDGSAQASPVSPPPTGSGPWVAPGTALLVTLDHAIDSGHLRNGEMLGGKLSVEVPVHAGRALPAGSPVSLTVVETVPAGVIAAQGEFSLQAVRLGSVPVYTDTLVFQGKPGHQDLPDSAPALGTDAGMPRGAALTFHVQAAPAAAQTPPPQRPNAPGSVDGVAPGGPPPPGALKSTYANGAGSGSGKTPGQQQPALSPGDTTTNQGAQNAGQVSTAPNQPQKPGQSTTSSPTQPR